MIYEFGRDIADICKSTRHFFRKLFCKSYYDGRCVDMPKSVIGFRWCCYENCPKRDAKMKQ